MIRVQIRKDDFLQFFVHEQAEHATPDGNGWLMIFDENANILAMYYEKNVVQVSFEKAGEENESIPQTSVGVRSK